MDAQEHLHTICRHVSWFNRDLHISAYLHLHSYGTDAEGLEIKIAKKITTLMKMKED